MTEMVHGTTSGSDGEAILHVGGGQLICGP